MYRARFRGCPILVYAAFLLLAMAGMFPAPAQPEILPHNTTGDGGPAIQAQIDGPMRVAIDGSGNLYIYQQADEWKGVRQAGVVLGSIRRVDASTQKIETVATACGAPWQKPRPECLASSVTHMEAASSGRLLLAESTGNRLRELDLLTGQYFTIVGGGDGSDSGAASPSLRTPMGFALDDGETSSSLTQDTNAYFGGSEGDNDHHDCRKWAARLCRGWRPGRRRQVRLAERLGSGPEWRSLYRRQRKPPHSASRRRTGVVETIAGAGDGTFVGEGGPATKAQVGLVNQIALDRTENLFFLTEARICRIDRSSGILTTVAGTGQSGFSGDGDLATKALISPDGLAIDHEGNLFIAEYANSRIRRIDAKTGIITTVAGNGTPHRQGRPGA